MAREALTVAGAGCGIVGLMGYGDYSLEAHRQMTEARHDLPASAVFTQSACHPSMNPRGVAARESRDSAQHPASLGVVFALDVSGSMGEVPHTLATKTLPTFMEQVTALAPDTQVLFMAVGNAFADRSPLQVGQFESEAAKIDQWLSRMHLEGGGGGLGESYDFAMIFAAQRTVMDCDEKRHRKGYFFMTGDEPPFANVQAAKAHEVLGQPPAQTTAPEMPKDIYEVTEALQQRFHVFFLIPDEERGRRYDVAWIWGQILHEAAVVLSHPDDTAAACALLVGVTERALPDVAAVTRHVTERMGRSGAEAERLVRAVTPYVEAIARGPLAPPTRMGVRPDPGFQG